MPKMKSNSSATKRFSQTASGKLKHRQSHRSHILTKKSPKRIRQLRKAAYIHHSDERAVAKMAPYL